MIEYRVLVAGNIERWLEERGSTLGQGSSVHHGILFDVTERKTLELQVQTTRERLKLAVDTGEIGLWSGKGNEEVWDEQIYRLLGYEPFSIPASYQAFVNSLHPEDRPTILDADARALGKVITQEYRVVWPDGTVRWIEGRKLPYHYGVMRDITDRKAREAYILKAERLEAAGQLLSGLAHDFNNFLATISASL